MRALVKSGRAPGLELREMPMPEVGINDAPRANEMVVILVMTTGARVHNRAGGLAAADIKVRDGQK